MVTGSWDGSYANEVQVLVDVPYDHGSLQEWVDEKHDDGVVSVSPALRDA